MTIPRAFRNAAVNTGAVERFSCLGCGNVLSVPLRLVAMPAQPPPALLDHHQVNPPLLEPGSYAIDENEHGRDRITGTIVLSPGDVRGMRIVPELVQTGCWSLDGSSPCMACEGCGAVIAYRTDDCCVPQETRFSPDTVIRQHVGPDLDDRPNSFALLAEWDQAPPDTRRFGWLPEPTQPRPALVGTRWRDKGLKSQTYRDDPPA